MIVFNFFTGAAASALALCWLLPNHQAPWTGFHADAWSAIVLLLFACFCLLKRHKKVSWSYPTVIIAGLCLAPLVQWGFGQIDLIGTAWISTTYMIGLLLAVLIGASWQSSKSNELFDILFAAIAVAATTSVAMQLCQWLRLEEGCICGASWLAPPSEESRISANFGQPNQLATLLVWGLLAYGWAWQRGVITASLTIAAAVVLLFGLALTQSRTGAVNVGLMVLCAWLWRRFLPSNTAAKVLAALALGYLLMLFSLQQLSGFLLIDYVSSIASRTQFETRLDIWTMFLGAAWQQPWLGYGWGQTLLAQVSPTTVIPPTLAGTGTYYAHAHNLFIDLIIWLGIPLGGALSMAILFWVVRVIKNVKTSQDAILVMLVLTVGLHAMLELPLHHAYFLLPLGLVVGALDVSMKAQGIGTVSQKTILSIFLVAAILLGLVVRDYFAVEESYNELRLERARIVTEVPRTAPDVLLLTQLRDLIILARLEPSPDLSKQQFDLIERVTLTYPTAHNMVKMAASLTYQGRVSEAREWLSRICVVSNPETCIYAKSLWRRLQFKFVVLRAVPWTSSSP